MSQEIEFSVLQAMQEIQSRQGFIVAAASEPRGVPAPAPGSLLRMRMSPVGPMLPPLRVIGPSTFDEWVAQAELYQKLIGRPGDDADEQFKAMFREAQFVRTKAE